MEISLQDLKDLLASPTMAAPNFVPGECVFIRTVTYHLVGKVLQQHGQFLHLTDAAWIADSGRFMNALKTGQLAEVEPVDGIVRVGLGSIVDVFEWRHPLPREQV